MCPTNKRFLGGRIVPDPTRDLDDLLGLRFDDLLGRDLLAGVLGAEPLGELDVHVVPEMQSALLMEISTKSLKNSEK